MALRRSFLGPSNNNNNNSSSSSNNPAEEMPFLQSFRQTSFDALEEHLPEIDSSPNSNDNFGSNRDAFSTKESVDANANVDISVDHITTEKTVTPPPKPQQQQQQQLDHQINYENMYFTDEEIPVVGYTSGDEKPSESPAGETELRIHKLMPLPDAESDFLAPSLVVEEDLPSITSAPSSPAREDASDDRRSQVERGSRSKPRPSSGRLRLPTDAGSSETRPVGRYPRFPPDGGFAETPAKRTVKSRRSGTARASESFVSPSNERRARAGDDYSELVGKSESEGSDESVSDADEFENARLARPASCAGFDAAKSEGTCGKFAVDSEEPIHMTLEEVRSSLRSLNGYLKSAAQSSSAASPSESAFSRHQKMRKLRGRRMHFGLCSKPRHEGEASEGSFRGGSYEEPDRSEGSEPVCVVPSKSLKHTLCNWFGIAKCGQSGFTSRGPSAVDGGSGAAITNRALPPVPRRVDESEDEEEGDRLEIIVQTDGEQEQPCDDGLAESLTHSTASGDEAMSDFASSIQKVKDCGWYWGPISGEMAERILSNEPDGSFVLRDSSDEYYIFSLTFKLNGFVRHVRIEHQHGIFSFGPYTKFKSHTIVEFIENAVEHSRSGRYLFFIHRRPVLGPMRVQLLHPVSRFKQVQSLQHTCRFAILKVVRRDHVDGLPIPERLKDYLNMPQYYTEQMQDYQSVASGERSPPRRGGGNET